MNKGLLDKSLLVVACLLALLSLLFFTVGLTATAHAEEGQREPRDGQCVQLMAGGVDHDMERPVLACRYGQTICYRTGLAFSCVRM